MLRILGIPLVALILFPQLVSAQSESGIGVVWTGGHNWLDPEKGMATALGLSARWKHLQLSAMRDFTFFRAYTEPDPRYRMETFSTGQQRCRDLTTGQLADTELCTLTGRYTSLGAFMYEANFVGPKVAPLTSGVGYRDGPARGPYVNLGLGTAYPDPGSPIIFLRASVGRKFVQVNIGVAAHWW